MNGKRQAEIRKKNLFNAGRVNCIRGELNQNLVAVLLEKVKTDGQIISYRPATPAEEALRCDFIVEKSVGTQTVPFAIQVKSSDYRAAVFREKERRHPVKRDLKVMVFVTHSGYETKEEAVKRLKKLIESFIKNI